MVGTVAGGFKAAATNKLRYGEDFYAKLGSIGGQHSTNGGFASEKVGKDGLTGRQRARIVGAKAGRISKRGFKFIREENGHRVYLAKGTGKLVKYEI